MKQTVNQLDINFGPEGYHAQAISDVQSPCLGCAFDRLSTCTNLKCTPYERPDGHSVIFVQAMSVWQPIGPSSDDYFRFVGARADLEARMTDGTFNRHCGYEIWRNAWLACEIEHGIRQPKKN